MDEERTSVAEAAPAPKAGSTCSPAEAVKYQGPPFSRRAFYLRNYRLNPAQARAYSKRAWGNDSVKIRGRLRWVVDSDREGVVEANRGFCRDDEDPTPREASSLAQRVLKNLALIRAYEARRGD